MLKRRDVILYAICAGTLAGCGQIGPLYLPKPSASPPSMTHSAPAAGTLQAPAASTLSAAVPAVSPAQPAPPPPRNPN